MTASTKVKRKIKFKQLSLLGPVNEQRGHNNTIAELVENSHNELEMDRRHISYDLLDILKSIDYTPLEGGIFIHLARYTQGGSVGVVPKSKKGIKKAKLASQSAPAEGDFLNKEAFMYFYKNQAFILSSGLTDGNLEDYLTKILRKANAINNNQDISVRNIANVDVVKRIRAHGIKCLSISSNIDAGAWSYSTPEKGMSTRKKISSSLGAIFRKDPNTPENEINNYRYELIINNKGDLEAVEKDPLMATSIDIYNEANEENEINYTIVLNDNKGTIKGAALSVSEEVDISRQGNYLDVENVKLAMVSYKNSLIKTGELNEQS